MIYKYVFSVRNLKIKERIFGKLADFGVKLVLWLFVEIVCEENRDFY